jgi:hypothetical protein
MAVPRKFIVDESCSSTYHCVSRTVRQAFLLAPDRKEAAPGDPGDSGGPGDSGDPGGSAGSAGSTDSPGPVDNHRRDWILERIRFQAQIFAVDCISLAVMSNHLHLLLRILPEVIESWSALEVAHRWLLLRPLRALRQAMGVDPGLPPLESEVAVVAGDAQLIARLRGRLASPSWYMKELKEWTARRVNREEGRTGAFWEERFRSFRVLDVEGLLRCALYIDLNPVAARMVDDPLLARYTSVGEHARSALGPQDVRGRARTAVISAATMPRTEVDPSGQAIDGGPQSGGQDTMAQDAMAMRRAARELWRRVLEAPHARGRHGAEPWREGLSEADLAAGMADFVASFDGMSFQPAVPARREPHHPRGVADDDESIAVVPVLEPIKPPIQRPTQPPIGQTERTESVQVDTEATEDRATRLDASSTEAARSDEARSDATRLAANQLDATRRDAATEEITSSSGAAVDSGLKAPAFRSSIAPRHARHRRQPPDVAILDMPLSEYLMQLGLLAELAQERGIAHRQGRREDRRQGDARRRTREEIELALGREADDRGLAALLRALFGSADSLPGEQRRLLAELLGGARLFGTAVGGKAALAAEALRRGRTKVVMAFRSEPVSGRKPKGQGKCVADVARRTSPAVPRAG